MLSTYVQAWMEDPDGGGEAFKNVRVQIEEHDPHCTSLSHCWLPRRGGVSDPWSLVDCEDCGLTMHAEGAHLYEQSLHGKRTDVALCHCCWKARIRQDALFASIHDHTISRRFFRWERGTYDLPWWQPAMTGAEENCNRTLGIKTPWGLLFVCMNLPLRQKPCQTCARHW